MASVIIRGISSRSTYLGLGLGLSLSTFHAIQQLPIRLDVPVPVPLATSGRKGSRVVHSGLKNSRLNPVMIKQICSGSVTGACAALVISTFSKPLTLLIGLLIILSLWASRHGFNIPYSRLQTYAKGINVRSALEENMAFKLSFGTTFGLAAFSRF